MRSGWSCGGGVVAGRISGDTSPTAMFGVCLVLLLDDVTKILETAIIQARLGDAKTAPGFATQLAPQVLTGVNLAILATIPPAAPAPASAPTPVVEPEVVVPEVVEDQPALSGQRPGLLTIGEAIAIRNEVAEVIDADAATLGWPMGVAEKLLLVGFVDVPAVQDALEDKRSDLAYTRRSSGSEPAAVTGLVVVQTLSGAQPTIPSKH